MNKALVEIEGKEIERIEYREKAVVTFRMIDELHERPDGTARKSFNRHKDHFIEGTDFFTVSYDEWNQITAVRNMDGGHDTGQRNPMKFLTESGYLMLVKPFNDDLAWKIQRALVNSYFAVKRFRENSQDHTKRLKQRRIAIQEELRAFREDEKKKKKAEAEAGKVMCGKKTLDDLNGYPNLREAAERVLETPAPESVERFLEAQCVWDEKARVLQPELYRHYLSFCESSGEEPLGKKRFYNLLRKRGMTQIKSERVYWKKIRLREPAL